MLQGDPEEAIEYNPITEITDKVFASNHNH